jgi:predicted nucleotidyltransferase
VDILVEFAPHKRSFDNVMESSFLLEDMFERKVEVVTPEVLGPHILREVERVSVAA